MRKIAYLAAAVMLLGAFHIGMMKDTAALCSNDANMMECP